jgi:hypothetical protein
MDRIGEFTAPDRNGRPMSFLGWSTGTRAASRGEDLASVLGRLPGHRLAYWRSRLRGYWELRLIAAEMERRRLSPAPRDCDGQLLLF